MRHVSWQKRIDTKRGTPVLMSKLAFLTASLSVFAGVLWFQRRHRRLLPFSVARVFDPLCLTAQEWKAVLEEVQTLIEVIANLVNLVGQ
jgi:hypothetical protein